MARFSKGLQGVIAGQSKVGLVNGLEGILAYRGYPIQDLASKTSYVETAHLLLNGKLPNKAELEAFTRGLKKHRKLPSTITDMIRLLPKKAHTMANLQTIVSALGCYTLETMDRISLDELKKQCIELIAQFPTIVAACWRASQGQEILEPKDELCHSGNFLYMVAGHEFDEEAAKIFDKCLILHAEHSFNASTFTARVVSSSQPSLHATVSAAVGSLYGPLHGGANERVLNMISEINGTDEVEAWVLKKLSHKEKIMGMGHRVYQVKDPRSYVLEEMLDQYAKKKNDHREYDILKKIESVMRCEMEKKGKDIWPNVDFFSGALYRLLEVPVPLFTPVFALSRVAGWCAHILEQQEDNRIYRPVCEYIGDRDLSVPSIDQR